MGLEGGNRIVMVADRVRRLSRSPLKVVLPTAAALGAGAALAIGAIPGPGGVITACYDTNSATIGEYGTLRVIDPTDTSSGDITVPSDVSSCIPGQEQTITWNQQGPAGPQGAAGAAGAAGASGQQGPEGAPGTPGSTGPPGPPGQNGAVGAAGAAGATGAPGTLLTNTTFSIESSSSSRLYLKFDGIAGPVSQKSYKNDIQLSSFAAGAEGTALPGSAGSGAGAGKITLQSFEIVKHVDSASPLLFQDLGNHKVINKADVFVDHVSNGKLVQAASYELVDVVITSIHDTQSNTEDVTGSFTKLNGTVGTGPNKVPTGWNRVTNTQNDQAPLP